MRYMMEPHLVQRTVTTHQQRDAADTCHSMTRPGGGDGWGKRGSRVGFYALHNEALPGTEACEEAACTASALPLISSVTLFKGVPATVLLSAIAAAVSTKALSPQWRANSSAGPHSLPAVATL